MNIFFDPVCDFFQSILYVQHNLFALILKLFCPIDNFMIYSFKKWVLKLHRQVQFHSSLVFFSRTVGMRLFPSRVCVALFLKLILMTLIFTCFSDFKSFLKESGEKKGYMRTRIAYYFDFFMK